MQAYVRALHPHAALPSPTELLTMASTLQPWQVTPPIVITNRQPPGAFNRQPNMKARARQAVAARAVPDALVGGMVGIGVIGDESTAQHHRQPNRLN